MLHSYRIVLTMLLLIAAVFVVPSAYATTFYVSTTGANTNAGTESSPWRDIQYAITTSATVDGDLILVSNGTYTEHLVFSTKTLTVASMYYITSNPADITNTVIDGSYTGTVVTFSIDATLMGFTIKRGHSTSNGGGIAVAECSPVLSHLIVRNSWAAVNGGGIYMAYGSPMLSNVTTVHNTATYGGGVYMETATPTVAAMTIDSNSAVQRGGGMYMNTSTPVLSNTTVQYNSASFGGGVYIDGSEVNLSTLTVSYNQSVNDGGGISADNAVVGLSNSTVASNTGNFGGGIYTSMSRLYLDSTVVTGNTANFTGGGIYIETGILYATNATLSYNTAINSLGGGAYINLFEPELDVPEFIGSTLPGFSHSDIVGNHVQGLYGGGLYITSSSGLVQPHTADTPPLLDPVTLYLDHTSIRHNKAGQSGGGVYWESGIAILQSVVFDRDTSQSGYGGALYLSSLNASLDSVTMTSNRAYNSGGGLYAAGCNIYASNMTVEHNRSITGDGGGIYQEYSFFPGGRGLPAIGSLPAGFDSDLPTVYSNIVLDSNRANTNGGGAYFYELQLGVFNSTVSSNTVGSLGGGIYSTYCQLILDSTTVTSNKSIDNGGGLYLEFSDLFATTATISLNQSGGSGGGVYLKYPYSGSAPPLPSSEALPTPFDDKNPGLTASSIDKNFANSSGGGLYIEEMQLGLFNSTVSENTVGNGGTGDGGGLYATFSNIVLDEVTVTSNTARNNGGGLYLIYSDVYATNATVVANESRTGTGGGVHQEDIYTPSSCSCLPPIFGLLPAIFDNREAGYYGSSIHHNVAQGDGGGMFIFSAAPTISATTISENSTSSNGGGMMITGAGADSAMTTLRNVVLTGNAAISGGAVWTSHADSRFYDVVIENNTAQQGGGLHSSVANPVLDNVLVHNNRATGGIGKGGGMYMEFCPNALLSNITVSDNSASNSGGGMYIYDFNSTMTNVVLKGNRGAGQGGGGMYIEHAFMPTFDNFLVSGNYSDITASALCQGGGGMYATDCSTMVFKNATITGNYSEMNGGGVLLSQSDINMINSIIWNNQADNSDADISRCAMAEARVYYSIVNPNIIDEGTNNIDCDPLFIAGIDPGEAPTTSGNLHLQVYSPAIGTGTTSATIVGPNIVLTASGVDIEGTTRGTVPDMGAYESTLEVAASTVMAMNDSAVQCSAEVVFIPVLDNDSDLFENPLVIKSYTQGTSGTVALTEDRQAVLYFANPGFIGTDTFTYSVSTGTCTVASTATVTVIVNPVVSPVITLDGVDDYLSADSLVTTQLDNVTMEAWVRWNGKTGDANFIILNGNAGESGYGLLYNHPNLIVVCGGVGYATANVSLKSDESAWYHVAGVRDNGTWKLYINGNPLPVSGNPVPELPTGATFIGGDHAGVSTFDGEIDEVRIWNTARTEEQLQQNMTAKLTGSETGLAAYYPFDEATGSTAFNVVSGSSDAHFIHSASWGNTPIISGVDTVFSNGTPYIYSVLPTAGTTYAWEVSNGTIVATTTNSVSIVWNNTYAGTVTVTAANASGCQVSSSKDVRIFSDRAVYHICPSGSDETGVGSEVSPFATVSLGIQIAQPGDTVLICPGTYYENLSIGKDIVVGSYYLTTGDTSYISQTVIDANHSSSVVYFAGSVPTTATLAGLTLQHGDNSSGGGLYLDIGASPLLDHLVVKSNHADEGGGMYMDMMAAPTLRNIHITRNQANSGGGLYSNRAFPLLSNVTVSENSSHYDGGGLYIGMPGSSVPMQPTVGAIPISRDTATLDGVTVRNNSARFGSGGGIYLYGNSLDGMPETSEEIFSEQYGIAITNTVVDSNSAMYDGGGLFIDGVSPILSNTTVSHNTTDGYGGGIYIESTSAPTLSAVTVSENSSNDDGGGLYVSWNSSLTWNGGTINNNRTPGEGGGLFSDGALLSLTGLTVAENSAGNSGGGLCIYAQSPFEQPEGAQGLPEDETVIDSCIIVRNRAVAGGGIAVNGMVIKTMPAAMPKPAGLIPGFLSIAHSQIDSNTADFFGGGVALLGAPITLLSSSISGNQSTISGGGIASIMSLAWLSNLTVTNNISGQGGGVYLTQSQILFDSSSVRGNIAYSDGGGLYIHEVYTILYNLVIDSNMASGNGGGIYMGDGLISMDSSIVNTNTAGGNGGGIALYASAPQLANITVSGNTAGGNGGGIYKYSTPEAETMPVVAGLPYGTQLIENAVISGNYASVSGECNGGGGLMIENTNTPTILIGSTMTGNNVPDGNGGGLLLNDASAEIINSIVWNNSAGSSNNIAQCSTAQVNAYYSVVSTEDVDSAYAAVECDPLFVTSVSPLTAPTTSGNLHLQNGSPAIGMAIDSLELAVGTVVAGTLDREGTTRGTPRDIGAYENALDMQMSVVTAMNDTVTTCINTPIVIPILLNDSSSKEIMIVHVTQGTSGTVTIEDATTATYTPNTGFFGVDSFTYIVNTGDCDRPDTAMVTVNIGNNPYLVVSGTQAVCSFASETYSVTDTNNTGVSYQWTISAPGAVTAPVIVGSSTGTFVTVQFGEFSSQTLCSLSVAATSSYGCSKVEIYNIQGYPQTVANAGSDINACAGDIRTLGVFSSVEETTESGTGGSGNFSYLWTPATGLNDVTSANPEVTVSTTTTYTLTVTDMVTGCTATDSVNVAGYPLPAVVLDATTGCGGLITTYTITDTNNTGANFFWNTEGLQCGSVINESSNTISILWSSVSETTVCTLSGEASTSHECLTYYSFDITINPAPILAVDGADAACSGSTHTYTVLDSNNTGATYEWSVSRGTIVGESTGATISVMWSTVGETTTGRVSVMAATDEGCSVNRNFNVAIYPNPVVEITGADSVYAGTSTVYSVTDDTQPLLYNWSVEGGVITSDVTTSTILVRWSTGSTITTIGAVNLTATNQHGCSMMAQFAVTVYPAIPVDISGDSTTTGDTTGVYGVAGVDTTTSSFQWEAPVGGSIVGSSTGATIIIEWDDVDEPTTATLSVSVMTEGGGTGSTTFIVQIYPRPILVMSGDQTVCGEGTETYTVTDTRTTGSSYEWFVSGGTVVGSSTGATVMIQWNSTSATTTASILIVGYEPHGFDGTTLASITVYPKPSLDLVGSATVCGGVTASYTVSDAYNTDASYSWTVNGGTILSGQGTSQVQVQWNAGTIKGTGSVTVNATGINDCTAMQSVDVTINPMPILSVAGDTGVCADEMASYTVTDDNATNVATFTWSTNGGSIISGQNTPVVTVHWTSVGARTLSVVGVTPDMCSTSASINVIVNDNPRPVIAGNTEVCADSTTVLDAGAGYASYLWSNGAQTRTITVATGGVYTVVVTSDAGCTATTSASVHYLPSVMAQAGSDTEICAGESTRLNGIGISYIGDITFKWTPETGLSDPTIADPIATPTETTTYTLLITDGYGCSIADQVTVTVKPLPQGQVSSNASICIGGSTQLIASGGASYVWTPATGLSDPTIADPIAMPTSTTTYTVLITGANGCSVTQSVTVTVTNLPFANAGADVEVCAGAAVQLQATGGISYSWSPATGLNNPNVANPIASPTETTVYTVTVSNQSGCLSTSQATVTVKPVTLDAVVLLEGSYIGGPQMSTALQDQNLLPLQQPYDNAPFNYTGSETMGAVPAGTIVDWVLIELRSQTAASSTVVRRAALLRKDGHIVDTDGVSPITLPSLSVNSGGLYVAVWHRTHLAIMSAIRIEPSGNCALSYNFTGSQFAAYTQFANPQKQLGVAGAPFGMIAADINGDGIINAIDRVEVNNATGSLGYLLPDASLDGIVNAVDRVMVRNNTFRVTQVP